jgi:hypothetical protein
MKRLILIIATGSALTALVGAAGKAVGSTQAEFTQTGPRSAQGSPRSRWPAAGS